MIELLKRAGVACGMAMLAACCCFLCDEPVVGQEVESPADYWDILMFVAGEVPREPVTYDMISLLHGAVNADVDYVAVVSFKTATRTKPVFGQVRVMSATRFIDDKLFVEGEMKVLRKVYGEPPAAGWLSEATELVRPLNGRDERIVALVPWYRHIESDDSYSIVPWDTEKPVICLAIGSCKEKILDATFVGPVAVTDVEAACEAVGVLWKRRDQVAPEYSAEEVRIDQHPWRSILGLYLRHCNGKLEHADYFQLLRTIRMAEVEPLVESQFEASGMIKAPHKGLASGLISFLNDAEKERQALVLKVLLSHVELDRVKMIAALRKDPAVVKALEELIEKRKADEQWAEVVKQYAALAEALKKQPEGAAKSPGDGA